MVLSEKIRTKLLESFFYEPTKSFTVRKIAYQTRFPVMSTQRYLKELQADGLISMNNQAILSERFRLEKIFFMLRKIESSGLLQALFNHYIPRSIILFGSMRKGEYLRESDIDIFLETHKKEQLDCKIFEKRLKHPIQLFLSEDFRKMPANLYNAVANGIILRGFVDVHGLGEVQERIHPGSKH